MIRRTNTTEVRYLARLAAADEARRAEATAFAQLTPDQQETVALLHQAEGYGRTRALAKALGLSRRTLRRRLAARTDGAVLAFLSRFRTT